MMDIQAVIDRFEGKVAVLVFDDNDWQASWPRELLPAHARTGDYVTIKMAIDREATRQAQTTAEDLLRRVLEQNKSD